MSHQATLVHTVLHGSWLQASVTFITAEAAMVAAAHADGSLPPQPYNYLHPPAALAGSNHPPQAGHFTLSADFGRSRGGFGFTGDRQAGITVPDGAFEVARSATSVEVRIRPVETPPGLPAPIVGDGNAYALSATGQPGNLPARLVKKAAIMLKWPHLPLAPSSYQAGKWHQLCSSEHAVITTPTISCPSSTLGIVLAVTSPFNAAIHLPVTPVSSTPLAWLNRYLPLVAALVLVMFAVVAGYFVTRPDKRA